MAKTALDHRAMPRRTSGYPIAVLRRNAGMTQQKLAELIGATQQQVAYWESGKREPPADVLDKIAKALNVTVEEITPSHPETTVTKYQIRVRFPGNGDEPFWKDEPLIENRADAHAQLIEARTIIQTVWGVNPRIAFIQSYLCDGDRIIKPTQMIFDVT